MHFWSPKKSHGFGRVHGNAETRIPEMPQRRVKILKTSAAVLGKIPGRTFLMRKQMDTRVNPMLAMNSMQPAHSALSQSAIFWTLASKKTDLAKHSLLIIIQILHSVTQDLHGLDRCGDGVANAAYLCRLARVHVEDNGYTCSSADDEDII